MRKMSRSNNLKIVDFKLLGLATFLPFSFSSVKRHGLDKLAAIIAKGEHLVSSARPLLRVLN